MLLQYHKIAFILCLMVVSSFLVGCAATLASTMVDLNRERYVCKIDPAQFKEYRGKWLSLTTIVDESKNTTNFRYYNPQHTIGYTLLYSSSSMMQPVTSYFWYALQKAFESLGIKIDNGESNSDAELSLTFKSLTDEEIRFNADLIKDKKLSYSKIYVVSMPKVETFKVDVLEQHAYGMLDSIVTTILNDPGFNKALMISTATTAPAVYSDPRYGSIKGVVLKNGDVIRGKILNMNIDKVTIQTTDGAISSYSFDKEVSTFIKE